MADSKGTPLTDHITFVASGASEQGERFVQIRIQEEGETVDHLIRIDNWGSGSAAAFQRLNLLGAHLISSPAQNEFTRRLQDRGPRKPTFEVATEIGPVGDQFVLPDRIFGKGPVSEAYLDDLDHDQISKYRRAGSLKGWTELAELARGNSRFMTALALGFAGPLGLLMRAEPPALQLVGKGGLGKTSIAVAVGSIWGRHLGETRARATGFGETWNQTINKAELVAGAHNGTVLILDETGVSGGAQTVLDTVFRLERSVMKGRMNALTGYSWWVPVLSTSNLSMIDMANSNRTPIDRAYLDRMIDIPAPATGPHFFETLHGFPDVGAFSARVHELAAANFGVASRRFLKKLYAWVERDKAGLQRWLAKRQRGFLKKARADGRRAGLDRVLTRMATIHAAGSLAIKFKLLPWDREEMGKALLACFDAHAELTSGARSSDDQGSPLLNRLADYIRDHRDRFVDLRDGQSLDSDHDHEECLGYRHNHKRQDEYLFSAARFAKIAGSADHARDLKHLLNREGAIRTAKGGNQGRRFAVKVPIIGKKRASVVAVRADFFP